jgi:hypothetical protein
MRIYIFACNNETMTDCIMLKLFGVADPYVRDIEIGDYCLLYNYSDKNIYGIWKALSLCGTHDPKAWKGKFKFQVRVERVSKNLNTIPIDRLKSLLFVGGRITWKYFGDKAQVLLDYYASGYAAKTGFGKALASFEEDYRKKHRNISISSGSTQKSLDKTGTP